MGTAMMVGFGLLARQQPVSSFKLHQVAVKLGAARQKLGHPFFGIDYCAFQVVHFTCTTIDG